MDQLNILLHEFEERERLHNPRCIAYGHKCAFAFYQLEVIVKSNEIGDFSSSPE